MRQIPQQAAALQDGRWQIGVGHTLRGKTLGIHGYGRIGATVAGYGRAFGMHVLVWAREASRQRARAGRLRGRHRAARRFYEESDVVSLHMRLVPRHAGIVTAERSGAHEADGAARQHEPRARSSNPAHSSPRFSRAGRAWPRSTCTRTEPLRDPQHPLLRMPNVVCTPHIGYVTRDEYELQFSDVFDQIVAYAARASDQRREPISPDALIAATATGTISALLTLESSAMVSVTLLSDSVVFEVEGLDKLWAFRSRLEIPLTHVVNAEVDPDQVGRWWHGWKLIGTDVPGLFAAGTF